MNTDFAYILLFLVVASYEIYNICRKKYEVLGIIIDSKKGAMSAKDEYFRTRKEAEKCYAENKEKFSSICIIDHN